MVVEEQRDSAENFNPQLLKLYYGAQRFAMCVCACVRKRERELTFVLFAFSATYAFFCDVFQYSAPFPV